MAARRAWPSMSHQNEVILGEGEGSRQRAGRQRDEVDGAWHFQIDKEVVRLLPWCSILMPLGWEAICMGGSCANGTMRVNEALRG